MSRIGLFIKEERLIQNMSQEALSEGICSNTYLSKIESGFDQADDTIIELLVDALGYKYETDVEGIVQEIDNLWERLFFFELEEKDYTLDLKNKLNKYKFSKCALDIYLLENLISVLLEETIEPSLLLLDPSLLNHKQLYRYNALISYYNYVNSEDIPLYYEDHIGYISYYKTSKLFLEGKYREAIVLSQKVYEIFSMTGNIMGMINISFLESSSYSNLNDHKRHIEISKRIERLNRYAKKEEVSYYISYNLGSSYLSQGDFEKANIYLMKCLDYDLDYERHMVYEKLVLLYLFLEDFDLAFLYFSKINEKELNSYHLLKELLKHNNDFTHDDVISELENCFNEEIIKHHGRGMLFGTLLYQAYRKTYQYPKALKVMESLIFNQNSLFFRK